MTKAEILKLIKWDKENKILIIQNDNKKNSLDISIHVETDIKGNVCMQNIGGYNNQHNIGGYNRQCDINGDNIQLNIIGDNIQEDISGYNYQSHIGSYNEQGDIGGYNNQGNIRCGSVQNNVDGYSVNTKHYIVDDVKSFDVDITDGVILHSITEKTRNNLSFIKGIARHGEITYLVKTPTISFHSRKSMEKAKEGWKNKRNKLIEGVKDFIKECKETNTISIKGFMDATGSCTPGTIAWLKKAGVKFKDDLSNVYDFDYAIEKFRKFPANELLGILEVVNG